MPTANQAGVYSSVLAYLNAVKAANSIVGEDVVLQMRKQPIEDKLFGTVTVRQDGRAVHDMYTFKVKTPAESKARWDDYTGPGTNSGRSGVPAIEPGRLQAGYELDRMFETITDRMTMLERLPRKPGPLRCMTCCVPITSRSSVTFPMPGTRC